MLVWRMSRTDRYDGLIAAAEIRLTKIRFLIAKLEPTSFSVRGIAQLDELYARLMELETHIERLIFERRRLVERRWTHRGLLGAQDVLSAVAQSGFVSPSENTRRERIAI